MHSHSPMLVIGTFVGFRRRAALALCLAGVSLAAVGLGADQARADCSPQSPSNNETTTCTDTETDTVTGGDNVTVNVLEGASIDATGDGINLGGDGTVNNDGSITGSSNGIDADGGLSVVNSGSIGSDDDAITIGSDSGLNVDNSGTITSDSEEAVQGGDDVVIINRAGGSIHGGDNAVEIDDDGSVTNAADATITGGDVAVLGEDGLTVDNSGTITGTDEEGVNAGDDAVITNRSGGAITGGDKGIEVDNDATVTNEADATITGADHGIQAGDRLTVTNAGTITGRSDGSGDDDGIHAGADLKVDNSGSISGSDGIQAENGATIVNSGSITGVDHYAINAEDDATVVNSGDLTGDEDGVHAGDGLALDNSGTITAGDRAVYVDGAADIVNSGSITGETGIVAATGNAVQTIYNSGTITATGGYVIDLRGGDDVLTTGFGSSINGLIDLGDGNDTLNIDANSAQFLDFASLPEIINAGDDVPYLVSGTQVLVVDPVMPSSFGPLFAQGASDLLGLVRRNGIRRGAWTAGSGGSSRSDDESGRVLDRISGAVAAGYTGQIGNTLFGAYGGAVFSDLDSADRGFDVDMDAYSGGFVLGRELGRSAIYATVGFGHASFDFDQWVGGTSDKLDGTVGGYFVTPEIGARTEVDLGVGRTIAFSTSANYVGLFLDGDTEGVENVSVRFPDQNLHYLQARARVALPFAFGGAEAATTLSPFAEIEGQADLSEHAKLLGVSLDQVDGNRVTGKLGAQFATQSAGGMRLTFSGQAETGTDDGLGWSAEAGLSIPF